MSISSGSSYWSSVSDFKSPSPVYRAPIIGRRRRNFNHSVEDHPAEPKLQVVGFEVPKKDFTASSCSTDEHASYTLAPAVSGSIPTKLKPGLISQLIAQQQGISNLGGSDANRLVDSEHMTSRFSETSAERNTIQPQQQALRPGSFLPASFNSWTSSPNSSSIMMVEAASSTATAAALESSPQNLFQLRDNTEAALGSWDISIDQGYASLVGYEGTTASWKQQQMQALLGLSNGPTVPEMRTMWWDAAGSNFRKALRE